MVIFTQLLKKKAKTINDAYDAYEAPDIPTYEEAKRRRNIGLAGPLSNSGKGNKQQNNQQNNQQSKRNNKN